MPAIAIPVYNAPDETIACVNSVLRHTPTTVRVVVIDDHGPDRRFFDYVSTNEDVQRRLEILQTPRNLGFVGACNLAFEVLDPEDVLLVNSDVIVGPEWYERIIRAGGASRDVATVSVFTNNGTILSVPHRNSPSAEIEGGWTVDEAAQRVINGGQFSRPVIPTAVGHCVLIKRSALNLVGGFDTSFGTGYGEEVDFSQRCIEIGLRHIVADDVFVFHKGSSSFSEKASAQKNANEELVRQRYPWYLGAVHRLISDPYSSLASAINRASVQLRQTAIAIDGHCFLSSWTGTQQTTLDLIVAMAEARPEQNLTVILPLHAPPELVEKFVSISNVHVETISDIMDDGHFRFDLILRPYQVNSIEELRWMKRIAQRAVVFQLDFIAFANPSYFASEHEWLSYRELTRLVLASVEGVGWISGYVRGDAERLGVRIGGTCDEVVSLGINQVSAEVSPSCPSALEKIKSPIVTVLGTNFLHKNRLFALRTLAELSRQKIECHFALAGPSPAVGSSNTLEAEFLEQHPHLRANVTFLGSVSEQERRWLYTNSVAVFYPTISEGFGMIPFEAALHGTPTISSRMGSLDEVLPPDLPTLETFDVKESANLITRLINSPDLASSMVASIAQRGQEFNWQRTSQLTFELIDKVLASPRNNLDSIWGEAPGTAMIYSADYLERIQRTNRRSALLHRVNSSSVGRRVAGSPNSKRRIFLKTLYRKVAE